MNFIYILSKLIIYPALKIFFKKQVIIGKEKVVNNKPLIIFSNHNNAFLDSIVLHYALWENIYTLTRGDVFGNKFKAYLLGQFHILPVYRFQEGFENLQKNNDTFEKTIKKLEQSNKILIFPEGNCIQEKRLRKFKKGMARIAFSAESNRNFKLGLRVQPIAINYTAPWKFRSSLEIVVGDPILISDYQNEYEQNQQLAMNKLNQKCESDLSSMMVILHSNKLDDLHGLLCEMLGNDLANRQKIAVKLNQFSTDEANSMLSIFNDYSASLKKYKIRDWVVAENETGYGKQFYVSFLLFLTFPLFIVGFLLNYINYKAPYFITKKVCKNREFYSSINLASAAFIYLILYLIYVSISSSFIENGFVFLINLLVMPVSGLIALNYLNRFKKLIGKLNWLRLIRNHQSKAGEIVSLRNSLLAKLN
jgi:glycerol-3-phosphate O-acyltransferase/dihydroxyacetone phosphate acyltransferase